MNKQRRKMIDNVINQLNIVYDAIDDIKTNEEDCMYNIQERFGNSEKYYKFEDAVSNLSYAMSSVTESIEYLEGAKE